MRQVPVTNSSIETPQALYTPRFFVMLAALFAYMSGHNLLAHFSQFVEDKLGGDKSTIGLIAGLSMVGSLLLRPWMGPFLDRVGARRLMIGAALTSAASFFAFQFVTDLVVVGLIRVLVQVALATFLMGVAVYSAQIAPPGRSAESLASVGIGGLAGLMVGPAIGDVVFATDSAMSWPYTLYHNIAAAILLISCALCLFLPQPVQPVPQAARRESFFRLVIRYWPGAVLIMSFCLAIAQTIPMTFLERLAKDRGYTDIKWFFLAYSPTAIALRIVLVGLPRRLGRRRTLLLGMTAYAVGIVMLAAVKTEAGLIVPAAVMGIGHCFSYPFLLDLVGDSMPREYRGTAVALALAVMDIGFLVGNAAWGYLIEWYGFTVTLCSVSGVLVVGTVFYALSKKPIDGGAAASTLPG